MKCSAIETRGGGRFPGQSLLGNSLGIGQLVGHGCGVFASFVNLDFGMVCF